MPIRPSSELMARVINVFTRNAMRMPVIRGMISIQGVMLNDEFNAGRMSDGLKVSDGLYTKPTMPYVANANNMAGIDVSIRYLMCVNNSTLHDEEARTVVSESGDTLSPKYAPEIIAPAIQPSLYPITLPIP